MPARVPLPVSLPVLPSPGAEPCGERPRCSDGEITGQGGELIGILQERAYAQCVPLNVTIETRLGCNLRCVHCYNFDRDARRQENDDPRPELSVEELLRVITEVRQAGCLFLSLTGGEVLGHPHLFDILDHTRELNLAVQILSNGTLLRPEVTTRLATYSNLLGVSVSVYGATAAVHDGITQVRGSLRRTWEGVERLRQLGIAVRVKLLVMRTNVHEVEAMMAEASARGLPFSVDLTITARHDGTRGSLSARIGREDLERLYRGPLRHLVPRGTRPITEADFPCNCARGNCAISSRGDVLPCIAVPLVAGNVREQPFAEIWRRSPAFQHIRALAMRDYAQCAPCPHRDFCSRDRGAAYNASGSYTGVDPFVCASAEIAHRLADEARGAGDRDT